MRHVRRARLGAALETEKRRGMRVVGRNGNGRAAGRRCCRAVAPPAACSTSEAGHGRRRGTGPGRRGLPKAPRRARGAALTTARAQAEEEVEEVDSVELEKREIRDILAKPYKFGFVSDIESESIPKGLSEDTVRLISAKKNVSALAHHRPGARHPFEFFFAFVSQHPPCSCADLVLRDSCFLRHHPRRSPSGCSSSGSRPTGSG